MTIYAYFYGFRVEAKNNTLLKALNIEKLTWLYATVTQRQEENQGTEDAVQDNTVENAWH